MNTSMFLPQVAEEDVYDKNGQQLDDINSLVEYIFVALGYDHTPDDEDDDSGQNFHQVKSFEYNYQPTFTVIDDSHSTEESKQHYFPYKELHIELAPSDIVTPPPEV